MPRSQIKRCAILLAGALVLCSASVWPQKQRAASASPLTTARTQLSHGQLDDAEKTLWRLLSSDSNNSEAFTRLGILRGRQKRYAEAEALFRRVFQLAPTSLVAHRNLAEALIAQNKPDAAL